VSRVGVVALAREVAVVGISVDDNATVQAIDAPLMLHYDVVGPVTPFCSSLLSAMLFTSTPRQACFSWEFRSLKLEA